MLDWYSFSLLVGSFVVLLLIGVPIAFAMLASGILFAYSFATASPLVIPQRLMNGIDSFVLMAVPFFVLVGQLMNTGGITKRIFDFTAALVGHVKGGLAYVDVLSSVIFAGMSGSAVADASSLGSVTHKAMVQRGYDRPWAASLTGASAAIGPLIPPSIPFVIYGSMTNLSIGKLLLAGAIPGLLASLLLAIYVYFVGLTRGFPEKGMKRRPLPDIWRSFLSALPALLTPIFLVGGIVLGYFTPTECAAVGCLYSAFLGVVVYREMTLRDIWSAIKTSAKFSCQILFIVAAASYFGNALAVAQVPQTVFAGFVTLASAWTPFTALIVLNVILLIVGMFLDTTETLIILVPILAPLGVVLGVDDIHLAVIIVFNVMIGMILPPVGIILFVMAEISKCRFDILSRAMVPFIAVLVVGLALITFVPWFSLFLPDLVFQR